MQDRSPAALCRGNAEAKLVRGNFLRIPDMRFRPANISVAASRTTLRRRIVETSERALHPDPDQEFRRHHDAKGAPRKPWRASSSMVAPATDRALKSLRASAALRFSLGLRPTLDRPPSLQRSPKALSRKSRDPLDKPFHISALATNHRAFEMA